jgi:hypothetical protein
VRGTPSSLCVQRIATNRSSAYEKVLTSFCCGENWNFVFVDRQFFSRFFIVRENLSFVCFDCLSVFSFWSLPLFVVSASIVGSRAE